MKTLLLPALLFTLTQLPVSAQAEKKADSVPSAETHVTKRKGDLTKVPPSVDPFAPGSSTSESKAPVKLAHFEVLPDSLVNTIAYLTAKAEEMSGPPMNIVITPDLEQLKLPALKLRNVTLDDVLGVIAKVSGLTLDPVHSSLNDGTVAAWSLTKGNLLYAKNKVAATDPNAEGKRSLVPEGPRATVNPLSKGVDVAWHTAAAAIADPVVTSRVIGISKIGVDGSTDQNVEAQHVFVRELEILLAKETIKCELRHYPSLQVIIAKGSPEAISLVEQTVTTAKENAAGKKRGF